MVSVAKTRPCPARGSARSVSPVTATPLGSDEFSQRLRALGVLMGDKSPSDLLEQLSRVMVRLVSIERQAYGLDVMPNPDPGAEASDQKVQSEVNKLWEQVQQIQKDKTVLH